jgi:hypothetical protein
VCVWFRTSCAIAQAKNGDVGSFKGNNTRRPPFFSACAGAVLVNNISARKKSRREVGGPAQRLQSGVRQLTGEHCTPTLDSFRAISAGGCLVSSKHCGHMWRQAQLTDAIRPSSAAVVENYYVAHLACCFMQCNLVLQAPVRLARD